MRAFPSGRILLRRRSSWTIRSSTKWLYRGRRSPVIVLVPPARLMTVDLLPLYNHFVDERIVQLDLRLSKILPLGKARIQSNLDVFNALNSSALLSVNQTYGSSWLQPTQIMPGRMFKVGFQVDF